MNEYIPDEVKKKFDGVVYPLTTWLEKTIFHVTTWDKEPLETLQCDICKGTQFNVGQANYTTAIRCINCGWEDTIHTG